MAEKTENKGRFGVSQEDLNLILFGIQQLIGRVPTLALALRDIVNNDSEPTEADWIAFRKKVIGKSYDDYITEAQAKVPKTEPPAA